MKDLFTLDIKNYLPQWNKEKRDSSRGIIIANEKKVLPFSPDGKISLVFAKNQGYYKFPGGDINSDKAYVYGLLDSYEYDDYDRLIQFIDSTCNADGTKNLEKRMEDVKNRYGYYPQAKYDKNTELKTYFEKLTGKDLYTVLQ